MARNITLDKNAPYFEMWGHRTARYRQGNHYFGVHEKYCGEVEPENRTKEAKKKPEVQSAEAKADAKKAAVLARAQKAMAEYGGDNGDPQEVKDAKRENAKAAAAEENA